MRRCEGEFTMDLIAQALGVLLRLVPDVGFCATVGMFATPATRGCTTLENLDRDNVRQRSSSFTLCSRVRICRGCFVRG